MTEMNIMAEKLLPGQIVQSNVRAFAEQIERQANTMAQSGWEREAVDLRNWASELRVRSVGSRFVK